MKFELFALVLVVASAYAMPPASVVIDSPNQPPPQRAVVESQIRRIIQQISNAIRDGGFDPLVIENEEFEVLPSLVDLQIFIGSLKFAGASNIRIHSLNYNIVLNRLRFDISLPQLSLIVDGSSVAGVINDQEINGQFGGVLIIDSIRLAGEARINLSVISGISLRSIALDFSVGGVWANVSVLLQENDFSEVLNTLLNESIPNLLEENRENINSLLENIVKEIFERFP